MREKSSVTIHTTQSTTLRSAVFILVEILYYYYCYHQHVHRRTDGGILNCQCACGFTFTSYRSRCSSRSRAVRERVACVGAARVRMCVALQYFIDAVTARPAARARAAFVPSLSTLEHYWQFYCASYWHYTSKRFTGNLRP